MHTINTLIKRDLTLAWRSGGTWILSLVFFGLFLALSAISFGGDFQILRPLAPSLIWLALILSLMLSFEHIFHTDAEDDTLSHLKLSGTPLSYYVVAKCCVHWILSVLPLLVSLPAAALLFNLDTQTTAGLFFSILIASPALICYGAFSGACLVSYKGGGVLLVILSAPILLPLLIFGVSAAIRYGQLGLGAPEFQALAGLSLLSLAIGIPASAVALNITLE